MNKISNIIFDLTGVVLCEGILNKELISWIRLNKLKYKFYILTNNISEIKELLPKNVFNEIFTFSDTGFKKPDKRSFNYALREIKSLPQDCLFIDDSKENILAARGMGFNVLLFENNDLFFKEIINILN